MKILKTIETIAIIAIIGLMAFGLGLTAAYVAPIVIAAKVGELAVEKVIETKNSLIDLKDGLIGLGNVIFRGYKKNN